MQHVAAEQCASMQLSLHTELASLQVETGDACVTPRVQLVTIYPHFEGILCMPHKLQFCN